MEAHRCSYDRTGSVVQVSTASSHSILGEVSEFCGTEWSVQRTVWNTGQDTSYDKEEEQQIPV